MSREGRQDLVLLALRDLEGVERPGELGRDGIELLGGDPKVTMRFLEAGRGAARLGALVLEGSARDIAEPEGPLELQAR